MSHLSSNIHQENMHRVTLVALFFVIATVIADDFPTIIQGQRELTKPSLKLKWEVDQARAKISFTVEAATQNWIGIGIAPTLHSTMVHGTFYVVTSDGKLTQYRGAEKNTKPLSSEYTSGLKLVHYEYNNAEKTTTFTIERNLKADGNDYDITDSYTSFLYAIGKSTAFGYHGDLRGGLLVNFWEPENDKVPDFGALLNGNDLIIGSINLPAYFLKWYLIPSQESIYFNFCATTKGWVGLGLISNKFTKVQMTLGSFMIGFYNTTAGIKTVQVYHGTPADASSKKPLPEKTPYGEFVAAHHNLITGQQCFTFKRKLKESDPAIEPIIKGQNNTLVWAFANGDRGDFSYHGNTNRGGLGSVDFFESPIPKPPTPVGDNKALIYVHGTLMTIAWAVLASSAIYLARFSKGALPFWWMRIHIALFFVSLLCMIAGLIVVLAAADWKLNIHDPHSLIGFLIFLVSFIQPVLGFIADRMFNPKRKSVPIQDKLHWYVGRVLFIAALFNIYLGLELVDAHFAVKVLYYFWVIFLISVFVFNGVPAKQHAKKASINKIETAESTDTETKRLL
jgi:hypothetical protein